MQVAPDRYSAGAGGSGALFYLYSHPLEKKLHLEQSSGHSGAILKIWRQSPFPFLIYNKRDKIPKC